MVTEVFCPAGATRCIDWVKFGAEEQEPLRQISSPSVQRWACRTPKTEDFTEILPNFGI